MRGCDQRRWWVLALATEGSGRVEGSVTSWCTYCNENTNALPSTSVVVAVVPASTSFFTTWRTQAWSSRRKPPPQSRHHPSVRSQRSM